MTNAQVTTNQPEKQSHTSFGAPGASDLNISFILVPMVTFSHWQPGFPKCKAAQNRLLRRQCFFWGPISKFCVLVRLNSQKPDGECLRHCKTDRKTISDLFWCPRCKRSRYLIHFSAQGDFFALTAWLPKVQSGAKSHSAKAKRPFL